MAEVRRYIQEGKHTNCDRVPLSCKLIGRPGKLVLLGTVHRTELCQAEIAEEIMHQR